MKKSPISTETARPATPPRIDSLPLGKGVRLLAADPSGLLAFEKPVNTLSHPNSSRDHGKALFRAFYDTNDECYRWVDEGREEPRRVWLLNRLDSATSGVILCATDPDVAAAVKDAFAGGNVRKSYFALVFGALQPPRQQWTDSLAVDRKDGQLRTRSGGGKKATAKAVLKRIFHGAPEVSLIELVPGTGRTHQLRVQCARRKLPVVGDKTYGRFRANREFARRTGHKRLFLHCAETSLKVHVRGQTVDFRAVSLLPEAFERPF